MNDERFFKCCKNCNRRTVGCHSQCTDYAAAVREHDEYKEAKARDNLVDDYFGIKKSRQMAFYYHNRRN